MEKKHTDCLARGVSPNRARPHSCCCLVCSNSGAAQLISSLIAWRCERLRRSFHVPAHVHLPIFKHAVIVVIHFLTRVWHCITALPRVQSLKKTKSWVSCGYTPVFKLPLNQRDDRLDAGRQWCNGQNCGTRRCIDIQVEWSLQTELSLSEKAKCWCSLGPPKNEFLVCVFLCSVLFLYSSVNSGPV